MAKKETEDNTLAFIFGGLASGLFDWLFGSNEVQSQAFYPSQDEEGLCSLSEEEMDLISDDFDFLG